MYRYNNLHDLSYQQSYRRRRPGFGGPFSGFGAFPGPGFGRPGFGFGYGSPLIGFGVPFLTGVAAGSLLSPGYGPSGYGPGYGSGYGSGYGPGYGYQQPYSSYPYY